MFLNWLVYHYRRVRDRKALSFTFVFATLLICILGNAICFYAFDRPLKPGISFADALWYSVVSVTTIGYGDHAAQSVGARLGTVLFIIILGLSTFTVFFGMLVDWVADVVVQGKLGMSKILARDHILLVNFPAEARVRQLVEELHSDSAHRAKEIVVVTDRLEKLPFALPKTSFVRGSPLQKETYDQAGVEKASMVLVLATSYDDPNSDAVVASAASVIDELNPSVQIVAECLDEKHRMLFNSARCDAIVPGLRIVGNLLAQEISDPGVARMIDVITSNLEGDTVYSATVDANSDTTTYCEIAKRLLDRDVNLLCVNRDDSSHTQYGALRPSKDDRVLYVAPRRLTWRELVGMTEQG